MANFCHFQSHPQNYLPSGYGRFPSAAILTSQSASVFVNLRCELCAIRSGKKVKWTADLCFYGILAMVSCLTEVIASTYVNTRPGKYSYKYFYGRCGRRILLEAAVHIVQAYTIILLSWKMGRCFRKLNNMNVYVIILYRRLDTTLQPGIKNVFCFKCFQITEVVLLCRFCLTAIDSIMRHTQVFCRWAKKVMADVVSR